MPYFSVRRFEPPLLRRRAEGRSARLRHRAVVACGPAVSSASPLKMALHTTPWKQAVILIEWMASNDHRGWTFEIVSRARESREGIDNENVANP